MADPRSEEEARVEAPPSPAVLGLVLLFLLEALVSRTHLEPLLLSAPVHIAATAALAGLLVAVAALRGLTPPPASIALPLGVLILLAYLSSAYSTDFTVFNLLFATVWTLHFAAIWWAVPTLLRGLDLDRQMDLFLVLAVVVIATSAVFVGPSRAGRFVGFFNTATQVGRLGALIVVWAFAEWVRGRRRGLWAALLAAAAVMVLLSRTRASIAAMVLGCAVVFAFSLFAREAGHRLRAGLAFFAVFGAAATSFALVDFGLLELQESLRYLRLSGGWSAVMDARRDIWLTGLDRLRSVGWLGEGFSEKFGGFAAEKWGIRYPTYDWTELVDPHNMLMTTAIQLGLPAALVLVVVLLALAVALVRLPLRQRAVGLGVFAVGLVFGLVDGNWFITFSPPDRVSMTFLALLVASRFATAEEDGEEGGADPP